MKVNTLRLLGPETSWVDKEAAQAPDSGAPWFMTLTYKGGPEQAPNYKHIQIGCDKDGNIEHDLVISALRCFADALARK